MTKLWSLGSVFGAVVGLLSVPFANATIQTHAVSSSYSVSIGIPSGSAISATTAGTLYLQLSAPTTYSWAGFGIGSQMRGATIFLMYADGAGNVTVSVGNGGEGEVQPTLNTALQSQISLLAGSGIVGGKMVANIRCAACNINLLGSTQSAWIAAWVEGSAINSATPSFNIRQHNPSNTQTFTFNPQSAAISSDDNPFVSPATSSSSSSAAAGGSTPSTTSPAAATDTSTGNSVPDGASVISNGDSDAMNFEIAHGTIMGLTVALLFPLGAILMRVEAGVNVHRIIQIISLIALIVGFGLGIKLAQMRNYLFQNNGTTHTIFGTIIIALFLLQPVFGQLHHANFLKHQSRTPISHVHIWFGRTIMLLAIVNGGLGLKLAANSNPGVIAYSVVAGVMGGLYILAVVIRKKSGGTKKTQPQVGSEGGSEELQQVFPHQKR